MRGKALRLVFIGTAHRFARGRGARAIMPPIAHASLGCVQKRTGTVYLYSFLVQRDVTSSGRVALSSLRQSDRKQNCPPHNCLAGTARYRVSVERQPYRAIGRSVGTDRLGPPSAMAVSGPIAGPTRSAGSAPSQGLMLCGGRQHHIQCALAMNIICAIEKYNDWALNS